MRGTSQGEGGLYILQGKIFTKCIQILLHRVQH